ncbi:ClpA/ClpB-like protein [Kribbella voronezhensis]|uniref:ClpA/ClpB-like protein n=1 Tax=Kribbella voronezhensis TaxID=2512212 RepID=A0A4R7TGT0_9ACTN|nr:Clp protease N-terminal domain-containing protein [Kribbella voronezhensis]TDU91049.1 ClpA/ClpB-like protein [Kribbella voronezhensis]
MSTNVKDVRTVLTRDAREEAELDGSAAIEAEHVLLGLTRQSAGPVSRLLTEAGLTRETIRDALDREWEQSLSVAGIAVAVAELPTPTPDRGRPPKFGESAKLVLKRAADLARRLGAHRITAAHILAGLLDTNLGRVARALDLAGVDRPALQARALQIAADEAR